jgi:hypothetical protein
MTSQPRRFALRVRFNKFVAFISTTKALRPSDVLQV